MKIQILEKRLSQLRRYYETVKNSDNLADAVKLQIALLQVDIIENQLDTNLDVTYL